MSGLVVVVGAEGGGRGKPEALSAGGGGGGSAPSSSTSSQFLGVSTGHESRLEVEREDGEGGWRGVGEFCRSETMMAMAMFRGRSQ